MIRNARKVADPKLDHTEELSVERVSVGDIIAMIEDGRIDERSGRRGIALVDGGARRGEEPEGRKLASTPRQEPKEKFHPQIYTASRRFQKEGEGLMDTLFLFNLRETAKSVDALPESSERVFFLTPA